MIILRQQSFNLYANQDTSMEIDSSDEYIISVTYMDYYSLNSNNTCTIFALVACTRPAQKLCIKFVFM
jgi:hypothetical protein